MPGDYKDRPPNPTKFVREVVMFVIVLAIVGRKLFEDTTFTSLLYPQVSALFNFDSDIVPIKNFDGEVESEKFIHRFVDVRQSYRGVPVHVNYHYVECGKSDAEPIIFLHGLAETWKVWKDVMSPFCDNYHVIAFDSEGMGQSTWHDYDLGEDSAIPWKGRDLRSFYGDVQMQAIKQIGIRRFNLVNFDYSFWSTLPLLHAFGPDTIIRFGKMQSTAGVEDPDRLPQAQIFMRAPEFADYLFNSNPYALARMLFGKPLLAWPGLLSNKRTGARPIDDDVFNEVILKQITPNCFKVWVWGYRWGFLMPQQMELQRAIFAAATYPVTMLQGKMDKGQPYRLFDGSATMELVEQPVTTIRDRILRLNTTHHALTTYSADGSVIGPKAEDFFPNSPWVKMRFLEDVGHFLHLEAGPEVIASLKELLAVPDQKEGAWYY